MTTGTMRRGDLVVVTSYLTGSWAVRRATEHGEVGMILGPSESDISRTMIDEDRWWRILLADGEIELPEWAIEAV